jgi:hypothetical protein
MNESPQPPPETGLGHHGAIEAKIQEINQEAAKAQWERWYRAGGLAVLVLVVLMAFWTVQQLLSFEGEKYGRARLDVKALDSAVLAYKTRYGDLPPSLELLADVQPDGGPAFLDISVLHDPWGQPYGYSPGILHPTTKKPLIISSGAPGQNKVVVNWPNK